MTAPATTFEILSPETIANLTTNTDPHLSCDDCFEQLDAAVAAPAA